MKFYDRYTDYTGWLMLLVLVIMGTSPTVGGMLFRLTWVAVAFYFGAEFNESIVDSVLAAHW